LSGAPIAELAFAVAAPSGSSVAVWRARDESWEAATLLLRKIRERMHTGSRRLTRALHQMYILRDAGDLEGARQQMRNVLEVEVIPFNCQEAHGSKL